MKTIVLDTNVLIDNVYGHADWLDKLLLASNKFLLVVPTIVVAEYHTAEELETKLGMEKSREYLNQFKIQDLTIGIAEILGRILRRRTYAPGANMGDLIVASTAVFVDGELATRNRKDFGKIPDLKFFDPDAGQYSRL